MRSFFIRRRPDSEPYPRKNVQCVAAADKIFDLRHIADVNNVSSDSIIALHELPVAHHPDRNTGEFIPDYLYFVYVWP